MPRRAPAQILGVAALMVVAWILLAAATDRPSVADRGSQRTTTGLAIGDLLGSTPTPDLGDGAERDVRSDRDRPPFRHAATGHLAHRRAHRTFDGCSHVRPDRHAGTGTNTRADTDPHPAADRRSDHRTFGRLGDRRRRHLRERRRPAALVAVRRALRLGSQSLCGSIACLRLGRRPSPSAVV